ncbi:MAG: hypothetical protein ACLR17_06685 [Enterobacteriaceae bacterium]
MNATFMMPGRPGSTGYSGPFEDSLNGDVAVDEAYDYLGITHVFLEELPARFAG